MLKLFNVFNITFSDEEETGEEEKERTVSMPMI